MALGTIVVKINDAEISTVHHDLPEGVVATTQREGQVITVTLGVAPKAPRKRKSKK